MKRILILHIISYNKITSYVPFLITCLFLSNPVMIVEMLWGKQKDFQ